MVAVLLAQAVAQVAQVASRLLVAVQVEHADLPLDHPAQAAQVLLESL